MIYVHFQSVRLTKFFGKFCGWRMDCTAISSVSKTPMRVFGCEWVIIGFYLM